MIPILYQANETNFNHNGLGLLNDTTSCLITENRNGIYELELTYPVGSFLFEEIKGKAIIKAKANDRYDDQLFRIYYISKPLNGKITIKGEHISYKLKDNFIPSLTYSGNVASVLELMDSSATYVSGFNFDSDVTNSYSFNFNKVNFLNAILGDDDSSVISTIGDYDIVRDNFDFSIKVNGGKDNNVLIAYKKNMTGFKCDEDQTNLVTKIYPYATNNDAEITLTEKYIESPLIDNYPNPIIIPVDFTNYFDTDTETIDEATLRTKASTYFTDTDCDIPTLTYDIEFIALSKTEEYKNFAFNESIALNDTVIIRHETYGLDTKVKVTKTIYNTIAEKYTKIELGQPKDTIASIISATVKSATKDKVTTGFLDKAISELSNAITGYDGGYVRLNPPSNPSEILIMDSEDINLAVTVWRWNKEGLGVSTTGYNGTYVGLAKDGKLVVTEATANKITANLIKAGTLMSNNNLSWINMDDGTFSFGNGLLTWNGSTFYIDFSKVGLSGLVSTKNLINNPAFNNDLGAYNANVTPTLCGIVTPTTYTAWGYAKAPVCDNALQIKYVTTGDNYLEFKNIYAKVKPNTTYTISYYYTLNGEYTGASSFIYERTLAQWNQVIYTTPTIIGPDSVCARTTWVRYTKTFTTQSTTDSIMLRFGFHQTHTTGFCEMFITGIQLELGSTATEWVNSTTSIVNSDVNAVSDYFQITSDGATFGDTSTGDYTKISNVGMQHHIGSSSYDYMYINYKQTFTATVPDQASYQDVTINYDSTLLALLNGRTPKSVVATQVQRGNFYCPTNYMPTGEDDRAWSTTITSTSVTMRCYCSTMTINGVTTGYVNMSYVHGGGLVVDMLIIA